MCKAISDFDPIFLDMNFLKFVCDALDNRSQVLLFKLNVAVFTVARRLRENRLPCGCYIIETITQFATGNVAADITDSEFGVLHTKMVSFSLLFNFVLIYLRQTLVLFHKLYYFKPNRFRLLERYEIF